jgi:DNA-binding PadR family transcriptional regulator
MEMTALGDLEQSVLLGILAEGTQAFALEVRSEIERSTGRGVSRGAFYTTLERLERKGLVTWKPSQPQDSRRTGSQRLFSVTPQGLDALRSTEAELKRRWASLARVLEDL